MKRPAPITVQILQAREGVTSFVHDDRFLRDIGEMVQGKIHKMKCRLPLVEFTSAGQASSCFILRYIVEATTTALCCSPDVITPRLPPGVVISSLAIHRRLFSVNLLEGNSFAFTEIVLVVDDPGSRHLLEDGKESICQEIVLALQYPSLADQLCTSQVFSKEKSALLVRQELMKNFLRRKEQYPLEVFTEMQHLLLATDQEFKSIRSPGHLLRLVRSHYWLRKKHVHKRSERQIYFRLFPTKLRFPFGTKDVISLAISLRVLNPYEHFDHRHIVQACKRCLPTLGEIPGSFYTYKYAEEPTVSLYIELEKKEGTRLSASEWAVLKRELGRELIASIEHVVSRIDIPQNEEDIVRNLLLLSQQVKTTKEIPQVIIQFHGQSEQALDFHVTLVRLIKKGQQDLSFPSPESSETTRVIPLRVCIVERFRQTYSKQGLVFLVQCAKEPFLRHDRSIDFLKARESVLHSVELAFGNVRDLNGGLIYQQNQLLESVRPLLTKEEAKEQFIVEDLFHSLSPAIMKNLLGPEHVLTVFRQFISLRNLLKDDSSEKFLVEEYDKELFIGFVCADTFAREEIFASKVKFQLAESELAVFSGTWERKKFCFVICLNQDSAARKAFIRWMRDEIFTTQKNVGVRSSIRISLARPPLLLDPRVGTDRTSGTVIKMLYEGLLRLDPEGQPVPAMAERVEISEDKKTYTFTLRPALWSNGFPVSAYDFHYAWEKILEPSFRTLYDYVFFPIKNALAVKSGKLPKESLGIRVVSDSTLVVELEKPFPYFLELCCLWIYSPLCREMDKTYPGWAYYADQTYVCNGPFKLTKWNRRSGLQLEKNELYWDKGNVNLEKIDIGVIEDPSYALELFERKELDWVGEPLAEIPMQLLLRKDPRIQSHPMTSVQWFYINVQRPPFGSKKVRHALSFAIDRERIVRECLFGDERIAHSILPSLLSLMENKDPLPYDLELAKRLFKEGLEEQNITGSMLRPIRIVVYDQEPLKSIANVIARSWERAFSVSVVIDIVGWHQFFLSMSDSVHDVLGCVWYSWFRDASYSFSVLKNKYSPLNASRWSSDEFTQIMDQAEVEIEKTSREKLLRDAEELVMEEMPIIPVFEYNSHYLKSDVFNDIYISHLGNVDFKWTTLKREAVGSNEI
jgi:oligopeptide transport system substrate-binding protein